MWVNAIIERGENSGWHDINLTVSEEYRCIGYNVDKHLYNLYAFQYLESGNV